MSGKRRGARPTPGLLTRSRRAARLQFGRPHLSAANSHRDRGEWVDAAIGYRRALDWLPWRSDLLVQLGNCYKELGDYRGAVNLYREVPAGEHRSDAVRQIEDANRRAGFTLLPYAVSAAPDRQAGDAAPLARAPLAMRDLPGRLRLDTARSRRWLGTLGGGGPAVARLRGVTRPSIVLDQVGSLSVSRDGTAEPLLTGVVAIRARVASLARLDTVDIRIGTGSDAVIVGREPTHPVERDGAAATRLYVVNAWIDSARLPAGRHWLELSAGGGAGTAGLFVTVGEMDVPPEIWSRSDTYVPSPADTAADVATAVIARPAEARPAARSLFDRPIRSVLALRADQLGDVSMSLPALARLRALLPEARLSVVVQPAVRAVVEASGLADEVLTIELSYDLLTERRYLAPDEEARFRATCAAREIDLAIDLCPGDELRPLLLCTGANYLVGFNADRFGYLDYGVTLRSRDKVNQLEAQSHAATVMTLVDGLATALASAQPTVPRVAASDRALAAHDLAGRDYIVIHAGARHAISRWPVANFLEVARRLLDRTTFTIVLFFDDLTDALASPLRDEPRVRLLTMLDGDSFDAIVANARLAIVNDSGPKHLAAVRGVPTVSVHGGKLNWSEWGQDGRGTILTKRVPCVGCGLNDITLCGRGAVCVTSVSVDEVSAAAEALLAAR